MRVDGRDDLVRRLGVASEVDLDVTPDTELVLRAYAAWGRNAFQDLLGDYALALWDGERRELICVRSPMGMRALYYAHVGSSLIVSNSLVSVRAHPDVSDRLCDTAIADFLLSGTHSFIDMTLTPYADVRAVRTAHTLVWRAGRVSIDRHWVFPQGVAPLRYASGRDYIEHFRHVFRNAVLDRVRTSNVVLTMSGGLDSTSVGATLAELRERGETSCRVQAVTLVFDELPLPREREFARQAADALGFPVPTSCPGIGTAC